MILANGETLYYTFLALGAIYYSINNFSQALKYFDKATTINSEYAEIYLYKGFIYYHLNDKKQALENYRQAAFFYRQQGEFTKYQQVQNEIKKIE